MIAAIRGTLLSVGVDHVIVEAGGIGYQVFAPRTVLGGIGTVGDEVRLLTYLKVSEDALTLYGFLTADQRALFETLLSVSGVGPKVAMNLLSSTSTDDLRNIIAGGDTTRLSRVPGVGKKTADRLVLELRTKVAVRGGPLPAGVSPAAASANNELAEMLVSLGFSAAEAGAAIASLPSDAPPELEERLRLALRYFGTP